MKLKYNVTFLRNSSPYKVRCMTEIGLINITSYIWKNVYFLVYGTLDEMQHKTICAGMQYGICSVLLYSNICVKNTCYLWVYFKCFAPRNLFFLLCIPLHIRTYLYYLNLSHGEFSKTPSD